jgi:hypothetical protein
VPPAPGWARVRERLRDTAGWDPARTYVLLTAEGADGGDHLGG